MRESGGGSQGGKKETGREGRTNRLTESRSERDRENGWIGAEGEGEGGSEGVNAYKGINGKCHNLS